MVIIREDKCSDVKTFHDMGIRFYLKSGLMTEEEAITLKNIIGSHDIYMEIEEVV